MSSTNTSPLWPIVVWSLQLLPAFALVSIFRPDIAITSFAIAADYIALIMGILGLIWATIVTLLLMLEPGRRWICRRRLEWCLSAASALISLAVVDATLTLTGIVPTSSDIRAHSVEYTYYKYSGYRMIPKEVIVNGQAPIVINSRGFRGEEIETTKPVVRTRIAFLGGSQVFDYHGGGWPNKVGQILRERGHNVDIINAGVPGHNTTDTLHKLYTDIWTLSPDIVFVCQGWNDVKYFSRLEPNHPYRDFPTAQAVSLHKDWRIHPSGVDGVLTGSSFYRLARYRILSGLYSEEGRNTWLSSELSIDKQSFSITGAGPRQYELNLKLIADFTKAINAETVLCKQAYLRDGVLADGSNAVEYIRRNSNLPLADFDKAFETINNIIDRTAKERRITVIDLFDLLSTNRSNFVDAVHYSPNGSDQVAVYVADALENLLK